MLKTSIVLYCILLTQLTMGEKFPPIEELTKNINWKVEDSLCKDEIYMGENYFGISTPLYPSLHSNTIVCYKHYDYNGKLLWSTSVINCEFHSVSISKSGNRILIQREPVISDGETKSVSEVYNQFGEHVFSSSLPGYHFYSSPNGSFYYSKPKYRTPNEILFLDSTGNYLYDSGIMGSVDTELFAVDDSTLLIYHYNTLILHDVKLNSTSFRKEMPSDKDYPYFTYSPHSKSSLVWAHNDLLVFDSIFQEIAALHYDYEILNAEVDDKGSSIGAILFDNNTNEYYGLICMISKIDGSIIINNRYQFPNEERFSDLGVLYYDGIYFMHRYKGISQNSNDCNAQRTLLFSIDIKLNKAYQYYPTHSWLFRNTALDFFIEINSDSLIRWESLPDGYR